MLYNKLSTLNLLKTLTVFFIVFYLNIILVLVFKLEILFVIFLNILEIIYNKCKSKKTVINLEQVK